MELSETGQSMKTKNQEFSVKRSEKQMVHQALRLMDHLFLLDYFPLPLFRNTAEAWFRVNSHRIADEFKYR